ncbi:hypothetical protein [Bradyrhizobium diazoefficiens]
MIAVGLFADRREPFVHGEGEGIARLRTVEGDPPDAVLTFKNEVVRLRSVVHFLMPLLFFTFLNAESAISKLELAYFD